MSSMSSEELMVKYLIAREEERQATFEAAYGKLTEREQRLVREAAVMGHVLGAQAAGGIPREQYPKDSQVVRDVVLAVRDQPTESYPYLSSLYT